MNPLIRFISKALLLGILSAVLLLSQALMVLVPSFSKGLLSIASEMIPNIRNPWRELDGMATELIDVKQKNTKLTHDLAVSNRKLQAINAKTTKLTRQFGDRLVSRLKRNISVNTGAIFAETVPILGVGVVIGTTVMDVNDACDTVNDINGLFSQLGLEENRSDASYICSYKQKIPGAEEVSDYWMKGYSEVKADVNARVQVLQGKIQGSQISLGGYLHHLVGELKGRWYGFSK